MLRKGLIVVIVLLTVALVGVAIAHAQGPAASDNIWQPAMAGGDLSKTNWTPVPQTGQDTHPNWWVDGRAKQHRQQYLEWLPSQAPQMPADALQKVIDDRQKEMTDRLAAPDSFKAAFTNTSFIEADGSKGFHYLYARAVLDKADSDLKQFEQPATTPTVPPPQPTVVPPAPTVAPQPSVAPTDTPTPQTAPGVNWLMWLFLAAIVIVVIVVLLTRKPKAS